MIIALFIAVAAWLALSASSPKVRIYNWNLLIALDQLANTALLGHPDETFSARTYRKALAGQWFWRES